MPLRRCVCMWITGAIAACGPSAGSGRSGAGDRAPDGAVQVGAQGGAGGGGPAAPVAARDGGGATSDRPPGSVTENPGADAGSAVARADAGSPLIGNELTLYVAPAGNDANDGSIDKPFLTVARARDALRPAIAAGLKRNAIVYLRGGTHLVDRPIELGKADGGNDSFSVTYQAYPGEKPIISGGRAVTGWTLDHGTLWKTSIPEVAAGTWWFRQLFVDGKRATRARAPNFPAQTGAVATADLRTANAEAISFQAWASARRLIQAIPAQKDYAYLEHALAFVDQPGEWYLDRPTGTLYYMAAPGADPTKQAFVAPRAEQLLVVRGDPDARVKNLWWKGISFQHAEWTFPAGGYNELFSGQYYDTGATMGLVRLMPAAVELEYLEKGGLEACEVTHVGASGIAMGRGVVSSRITGCEVSDAGGKGIDVGYRGRLAADGRVSADDTCPVDAKVTAAAYWDCYWNDGARNADRDLEITDNYVHHVGRVFHGAIGIELHFVERFQLSYNLVHDTNYSALTFSNFADVPNRGVAAFNQVHHFQQMPMPDGGGIYTAVNMNGTANPTVLRSNYVPDGYIYLDGGPPGMTTLFTLEGNVTRDDYRIFNIKPMPAAKDQILKPTDAQMRDAAKATGPREPHRSRFKLVDDKLTTGPA